MNKSKNGFETSLDAITPAVDFKGRSPVVMIGKILHRNTLSHLDRDKVPAEYWLVCAEILHAISGARRKILDDQNYLIDGRCDAAVSSLGISPIWFRRVLVTAGVIKGKGK